MAPRHPGAACDHRGGPPFSLNDCMHCGAFLGDITTVSVCSACTSSIFAPLYDRNTATTWTRCPHCRAQVEVYEPWCESCSSLITEASWTEYSDQFWSELEDADSDQVMVCCGSTQAYCECVMPLGTGIIDAYAARDEGYARDAQCFRCAYFYTAECAPLCDYIRTEAQAAAAQQDPPRLAPIVGCDAYAELDDFDNAAHSY